MEEFVDHIPLREGDELLVSTAATRFLFSVRQPFVRLYAIWFSISKSDNAEGGALFEKYSISCYVRSEPVSGYLISFNDLCLFVSEDAQARTNPLFKPLTGCSPNPFTNKLMTPS